MVNKRGLIIISLVLFLVLCGSVFAIKCISCSEGYTVCPGNTNEPDCTVTDEQTIDTGKSSAVTYNFNTLTIEASGSLWFINSEAEEGNGCSGGSGGKGDGGGGSGGKGGDGGAVGKKGVSGAKGKKSGNDGKGAGSGGDAGAAGANVKINCTTALVVDGELSVNGDNGVKGENADDDDGGGGDAMDGGGGAGGGGGGGIITINTESLKGDGTIAAAGGKGGDGGDGGHDKTVGAIGEGHGEDGGGGGGGGGGEAGSIVITAVIIYDNFFGDEPEGFELKGGDGGDGGEAGGSDAHKGTDGTNCKEGLPDIEEILNEAYNFPDSCNDTKDNDDDGFADYLDEDCTKACTDEYGTKAFRPGNFPEDVSACCGTYPENQEGYVSSGKYICVNYGPNGENWGWFNAVDIGPESLSVFSIGDFTADVVSDRTDWYICDIFPESTGGTLPSVVAGGVGKPQAVSNFLNSPGGGDTYALDIGESVLANFGGIGGNIYAYDFMCDKITVEEEDYGQLAGCGWKQTYSVGNGGIEFDDGDILKIDDEKYFCAKNNNFWKFVENLDNYDYKSTCEVIGAWTGTRCCGDDDYEMYHEEYLTQDEFYAEGFPPDEYKYSQYEAYLSGCFATQYIPSNKLVEDVNLISSFDEGEWEDYMKDDKFDIVFTSPNYVRFDTYPKTDAKGGIKKDISGMFHPGSKYLLVVNLTKSKTAKGEIIINGAAPNTIDISQNEWNIKISKEITMPNNKEGVWIAFYKNDGKDSTYMQIGNDYGNLAASLTHSEDSILNFKGEFYGCKDGRLSFYEDTVTGKKDLLTRNAGECEHIGDYYCDLDTHWKYNESSQPHPVNTKKEIIPGTRFPPGVQFGCCNEEQCWDGLKCVDKASTGDEPYGDTDYKCVDGTWTYSTLKDRWDKSKSGYCNLQSQCFVDESSFYENVCINNSEYISDKPYELSEGNHYCFDGTWTTRTALVGVTLNKYAIGKKYADYNVFCDDLGESTNNEEISDIAAAELSKIPSVCILHYNEGGEWEGNVVTGVVLDDYDIGDFVKDISEVSTSKCGAINSDLAEFQKCPSYSKVWYNPKLEAAVYSDKSIDLAGVSWFDSFSDFLTNPIQTLVNVFKTIFAGSSPPLNIDMIENVSDLDKLYIEKVSRPSGSREMVGYLEEESLILGEKYVNLGERFKGFSNVCTPLSRFTLWHFGAVSDIFSCSRDERNKINYILGKSVLTDTEVTDNWKYFTSATRARYGK